jgi:Lar family restriction alleviation protein
MSDEVKLKPCPFCGGDGEMSWYAKGNSSACAGYFVECTSCSASGEGFDIQGEMPDRDDYTKSRAVAAWNTRSQPSTPPEGWREAVARLIISHDDHTDWSVALEIADAIASISGGVFSSVFVKAEAEAAEHGGLKDCRDNDGGFYQSQWMECLLDKCRSLLSREG